MMKRIVLVRQATLADADRLIALVTAFHGETGHAPEERQTAALVRMLAGPALGRAWIAVEGGSDVGYGLALFRHSIDHGGPVAFLDDLYIAPDRRRHGLGGLLLAAICRGLAAAGVAAVELRADPQDEAACRFYRGAGFTAGPLLTFSRDLEQPAS